MTSEEEVVILPFIILEEDNKYAIELQANQAILLGYTPIGAVSISMNGYMLTMMYSGEIEEQIIRKAIKEVEEIVKGAHQ